MTYQSQLNSNLPSNYLQFHEKAYVSPLNLINVSHPAPITIGRVPHLLQKNVSQIDPLSPRLQSIDTNKLHMYQFLAQRKIKEERWKKELDEKNLAKQKVQPRNIPSAQSQKRSNVPPKRSSSAPKKPISNKINLNSSRRSQNSPRPIEFTRPIDPFTSLPIMKQNEINDAHEQLLVQLRVLHNPPARENIIDETEQERQRRMRLKRERIRRDSRAIYNAHQELKQIIQDIRQPDANFPRIIHRHLNAYKAILLAAETLANEAPIKTKDADVQQLVTAILPILETLTNANHALGLSHLRIDPSYFNNPPAKGQHQRTVSEHRSPPSNPLLPSIYNELIKKKQKQKKPRPLPSVLRPRSAEPIRLPRSDMSTIVRPTISTQHKNRARSHSPLPSVRSASTIETPFYSRYTVDHILVKLAPRLLANYNGQELSEQIERAQTLIPMFLSDSRLSENEITERVLQMIIPRRQQQQQQVLSSTTPFEIMETPEERQKRININVYEQQISTWHDEMSQIRQRLQNYKTNRLEDDTSARRTVKFQIDSPSKPLLPENVQIHNPRYELFHEDLMKKSIDHTNTMERAIIQLSSQGRIRLNGLDSHKTRQIQRYQNEYKSYLERTESAKTRDFDPSNVINRIAEFLLDEALLTVVNEVETLTVELSQKLVEHELLGQEISLGDVANEQKRYQQNQRPIQRYDRKHSPISPSPLNDQYYTSSFEDDINTDSKRSRSEEDKQIQKRKSPMEGTGRFVTGAFEHKKLSRNRASSQSSGSSSPSHSEAGIFIKPSIVMKKPISTYDNDIQHSDPDVDTSSSSSSKRKIHHHKVKHEISDDNDDDDNYLDGELLLSTKTGEKIYSTDFEDSKIKLPYSSRYEDDDEDDGDTMKLSARSVKSMKRRSFNSDDEDD